MSHATKLTTYYYRSQQGLSLVELMVAVVIGLLTVLAISQSMSFFEGQRRGTMTGADAQSNSALATYLIERDLRITGYGIYVNDTNLIQNCSQGTVRSFNSQRNPQEFQFTPNSVPFVPVSINPPGIPAGDLNTDVIGVSYSSSGIGITGKGVKIGTDTGTGYTVQNTAGFVAGDMMLAVSTTPGNDCSLYEITDGPGTVNCTGNGALTELQHGNGSYPSRYHGCTQVTPTRNKPGGLGVTATAYTAGKLFNLGGRDGLIHAFYAVRRGQLTRCDYQQSDCTVDGKTNDTMVWVPIANEIVSLRAEFGIAAGGGAVDTWRTTICNGIGCSATAADWQNLRVMRLAIVARSLRPAESGNAVLPKWGGQTPITLNGEWQNYRYSTTEVVVPLRNIIWGATS
jgi:type IV pilus assembly protein PilW